uniref:Succinate dehydrogenase cytochrome b560 subunit n=1 Tax=Reclinomonas americana TaxID=48483 RepID=C560_RECAM|nr:succinate:ubiquinone oxidoreductase subunit 3 [Reclinomonas americana]P80481.1 RecName: Full=Succinate dehydrogenase cytochrome b560 subunit; AltName: Full=Succinate dehydrogenase, subunit III [Reclinomonas americana]AAD11911.1 succinate:ubiquinone oxidoreductase subunit 3 [Reclinomonas americana]
MISINFNFLKIKGIINMNINRPISPHLTIYKLQITNTLSIFHRITGGVLALTLCFFILILKMLNFHLSSYAFYSIAYTLNQYSGFLFIAISFFLLLFIFYHLFAGLRHLVWDAGYALEIENVYLTGYIMLGLAFLFTLIAWIIF